MAATVTFTATAANGKTFTRTSPTMPYTHVLMVNNSAYSWHKSAAAAEKARSGKVGAHFAEKGWESDVVPAVPTSVQGVANIGDFPADKGWQEEAINALIEAKNAPKAKAPKKASKGKAIKSNVTVYESATDALADILPEVPADPELEDALADLDTTEVEPEADATLEQVTAEVEATAPAKRVSKKQALGDQIVALVNAAMADGTITLPEGLDAAEANEAVGKWLQHVPTSANPGGRKPRPGDAARKAAKAKA
ncbi:hypothetical protein SEA_WALELIANO_96 [Mycobacterium phage Waleliano]|uniref:Uncharacterized protein n=3 Tax=Coopervirus brownCNA TaxID=1983108 RepID=A0A345KWQ8_9CAUD|nr:hypothetical protein SEA_HANGMAN_97 [Mycobacterium phage Hangman]QBI96164.1 hypothetical protein SEA_WALELIANO_96 [Mycobacterium phage Waleliano]QOC58657.1 hypothetical protein SEALOLALOVE_99 [Mycobacterium phage Lolalove]UVK59573.1 hypothetical protein SEA_AUSTELLE_97 [Mycobacterium phage Austelle]WNM65116.1 hypothetical protein SEA_MUDSLIDE_98 [Mycobacterium phage Mudslide]